MRVLNGATLTQIGLGVIVEQGLVRFDFTGGGSSVFGFWTGTGTLPYNGDDYKAGGSLIEFDEYRETEGLEAVSHVMTLRAVPNSQLTPDVLATIESEPYHNAPVKIYSFYASPDAPYTALSVETEFTGYISRIEHVEGADGSYALEGHLISKARDGFKTGHNNRSDANQRALPGAADDGFFQHAGLAAVERIVIGGG